MDQLKSIRTNIFYIKDDKGEFIRHKELVFLIDKPTYIYSNEGEIIRERKLKEIRFVVSDKNFDTMIELLKKLKNASESDLE